MRCESCFLGLDHEHVAEPTTEPDFASQLAEECYPVSSHASLEMCIRRALKRAAEVADDSPSINEAGVLLRSLAADHDAEVKRLKAELEEQSECRRREHARRCQVIGELEVETQAHKHTKERLAAADALLRDAPTGQGAYMLEWRRKRDAHLSQSPAIEAPTVRCWMPGIGAMCYRYQLGGANCTTACAEPTPSQAAPAVTAQSASIERRLQLEIENRQALETELERLESRVAALEPKAETKPLWQCSGCRFVFSGKLQQVCPSCKRGGYWTGSVDPEGKPWVEPVPEPPLVTHTYEPAPLDTGVCYFVHRDGFCGLTESRHTRRDK